MDEVNVGHGVQAGKYTWVNLTEGDIQQYRKECDEFAKTYTTGANTGIARRDPHAACSVLAGTRSSSQ